MIELCCEKSNREEVDLELNTRKYQTELCATSIVPTTQPGIATT